MAKEDTTVREQVQMDDGSLVEFAGKRKMQKTSTISADGFTVTVRLDFRNGEARTFEAEANHKLFAKFACHGIEQKLGDEIAGLDDVEDAVLAVDDLIERLNAGEWGVKRETSGLAGTSVLLRALVQHSGKHPTAIKTYLASKSTAEKLALRKNPAIAPIIVELEANKKPREPKPVASTDHLLEELAS